MHVDRERFFSLCWEKCLVTAWLLLAGQSAFVGGSLELDSGRIDVFKNEIVKASMFNVCFRDNLSPT